MAALGHPIASPPGRTTPPELHPLAIPRFASFVGDGLSPTHKGRSVTLAASLVVHCVLVAALLIVPLFFHEVLPVPGDGLRAFFVGPPEVAPPPPPPPPPPPAGTRMVRRAPAVARPPEPSGFVAPVEVPAIQPSEPPLELDLEGVEGGIPGGVEGGVPGGVMGGIVGGLPAEQPPPPNVVRIGGKVTAPKLVHVVKPEYPLLAQQARLRGIVILEARVGTDGRVKEVKALSAPLLLVDSAIAAVKQWRYVPLLLNGAPVEFILTVTVRFNFQETVSQ